MQPRPNANTGLKGRLDRWWLGRDSASLDLLRGSSVAGVLKAIAAILSFALTVVLGRILGTEMAGIYFLALMTVMVAAAIGRVGLDNVVVRLVAARASVEKWTDVSAVYRSTVAVGLICSGLVSAALYFAADLLANSVFSDVALAAPIRFMAVAVVPLALSVLVSKALLGLSRVRDSILVFSILPTGIAVGGTWVLGSVGGVNGAIVAYVIAVSVAFVYGWVAWRRALAARSPAHLSRAIPSPTRELLKSGMPLLIGDLLYLMMQVAGPLMLGIWATNADVGQYAVAWRTALLITFVLLAVGTIIQPKFAELFARGDIEALAATTHRATLLMIACAAPIFLAFVVAPNLIMSVFGSDFVDGAATLQILSVGQFINVAMGSAAILLLMSGQEREFRNGLVISAIVLVSLNVVLIPRYGTIGAAIAMAAALVVQNTLFGYAVWRRLGILMIGRRVHVPQSVRDAKSVRRT